MIRPHVLAAALLLAACGDTPPEARVHGRWVGATSIASVEFFPGGRMLLKSPLQAAVTAEYEFVEPDRVLMVFADGSPADYRVRVRGDSLRMCKVDEPAKCYDFLRADEGG